MDRVENAFRCEPSSSSSTGFKICSTTPSTNRIQSEFEYLLSESSDEEEDSNNQEITSEPQSTNKTTTINRNFPEAVVSEDANEIILSIIWNKNQLGAAYYDIVTSELFVMEDTTDDTERFDVMKALYRQCQPHYLITIAGAPIVFANALKRMVITETLNEETDSFGSNERARNTVLKVVCKKDNSYERCVHRVRCLQLEFEPRNASNTDRLTFLNSMLNFKCCVMIHALGSLLLFIDKHWNNIALDPSGKPSFAALNYVKLHDLVMMDEDTYKALNIVQARDHPSLFKFGKTITTTKGASLFSLLNRYCQSGPGSQFLWKTLRHPTRNLSVLKQRLNAVEFFLDPANQSVVENLSSCLKHVYRLTNALLVCCSGPQAKASNWYKLHKTVSHVICIGDICEDHAEKIQLFKQTAESITNEMQCVKYFVEYIIDFGESRREGRLSVKPNVDPLLDELNHMKRTLPELLTKMAEKDMREHLPPFVTGCNMLYLPNIGYVLAINKWNPTPPENVVFRNLEFKFKIRDVHYYKSSSAKELDDTVGDIILKIAVRQNSIVQKLIRYVKKHSAPILHAIQLCAELDTLLAFSKVARDYNYVRPVLTESRIIDIREGRHPLLECFTTFVPNDVRSENGGSLIKVVTGPNSCGKSVYLKQIGLVIFMAHIGSYVPAKSATIGTVTRILTQMLNTESVGLYASSFLQNLRQINVAIRTSTPDSVVITDELDRGTSEISGLSLVAAVLNTFAERGDNCPHVFAATHAHSVLALLPRTPLIELQTFEYVLNEDETLAFLYRVTNGSTTRSFAHFVARIAELDKNIVKRSLEVFEKMKQDALPLSINQRSDTLKRIVQLSKRATDFDSEELKSLVLRAVTLK
ncbi:mutS protein homolog 5-like [Ptiloglossa arizonensis]|uniref:mutS protein homolog 5-like n=1 Tax=Ptiloglossa arizonensis TaxID=3350558 RepID=UPI003FA105C5